jgi:hypothetical protein
MSSQTIIEGFDPLGPIASLILPPRFRKRQSETRFKQEWKLTVAQYLVMMREFKGPKRQQGVVCAAGIFGGGVVVLTNHSVTDVDVGASATSGVRFVTDGTLEEREGGSYFAVAGSSGEWWSEEPISGIGSTHEVRALSAGKTGTWSASGAADNVWATLSSNREWNVFEDGGGINTASATFELGNDGAESADDSAVLTCTANNDIS